MNAINDAMLIEMLMYKLLKRYFRSHSSYLDIIELFHDTTFRTEMGQMMDLITSPESVDYSRFTLNRYSYIVKFKTSYYSFYLPIALALLYANITDPKAFQQAETVLIPLGEYFQIQDDYLDCFGSPEVIGKIGTDIEDRKCSWLIVQALNLASPAQKIILHDNYGQKDLQKVKIVKRIYKELNLEEIFKNYEQDSYIRIGQLVNDCIDNNLIPAKVFLDFMNLIYKRKS